MDRKRWSAKTEVTPALLKFREKRKWQIALRRYVLEKNVSVFYAPYFGLDIENMRKWFELQFEKEVGWSDFGEKWQFDHIIPVACFDSSEEELKLCWNFTNIRVAQFSEEKRGGNWPDVLVAKKYFEELYKKTSYPPCGNLLKKIAMIELSQMIKTGKLQSFIIENKSYLDNIENYSVFEFELLNRGRNINEIKKEMAIIKKFEN